MHIRPAQIDDSADLAYIQVDSYRAAYAAFFPPSYLAHFTYQEQEQDWRDWLSDRPDDVLLVAETDAGEVVGYALGRPKVSETPPYDGELLALHVRQSHQRQGIGTQLIAATAAHLAQAGCKSLILWTIAGNRARSLYERLGGRVVLAGIPSSDRTGFAASVARHKGLSLVLSRRMKAHHLARAIAPVEAGLVPLAPIISGRFSLEDADKAFAELSRRGGLKVVVEPSA